MRPSPPPSPSATSSTPSRLRSVLAFSVKTAMMAVVGDLSSKPHWKCYGKSLAADVASRTSLEVRPGLAADRSPGASARLGPLVEDGAYGVDTVADHGIGHSVDTTERVGACPGE